MRKEVKPIPSVIHSHVGLDRRFPSSFNSHSCIRLLTLLRHQYTPSCACVLGRTTDLEYQVHACGIATFTHGAVPLMETFFDWSLTSCTKGVDWAILIFKKGEINKKGESLNKQPSHRVFNGRQQMS